jgi:hypothetical protein
MRLPMWNGSVSDCANIWIKCSWSRTECVGRLHRLHESKKVVEVYQYVDCSIPMLARMFDKRVRGYEALGYAIHSEVASLTDEGAN